MVRGTPTQAQPAWLKWSELCCNRLYRNTSSFMYFTLTDPATFRIIPLDKNSKTKTSVNTKATSNKLAPNIDKVFLIQVWPNKLCCKQDCTHTPPNQPAPITKIGDIFLSCGNLYASIFVLYIPQEHASIFLNHLLVAALVVLSVVVNLGTCTLAACSALCGCSNGFFFSFSAILLFLRHPSKTSLMTAGTRCTSSRQDPKVHTKQTTTPKDNDHHLSCPCTDVLCNTCVGHMCD